MPIEGPVYFFSPQNTPQVSQENSFVASSQTTEVNVTNFQM